MRVPRRIEVSEAFTFCEAGTSNEYEVRRSDVDVDPEKGELPHLHSKYGDCFATPSEIRQTPVAKQRILIDETAHTIRQRLYPDSPKERAAVHDQIQEMLADGII